MPGARHRTEFTPVTRGADITTISAVTRAPSVSVASDVNNAPGKMGPDDRVEICELGDIYSARTGQLRNGNWKLSEVPPPRTCWGPSG